MNWDFEQLFLGALGAAGLFALWLLVVSCGADAREKILTKQCPCVAECLKENPE